MKSWGVFRQPVGSVNSFFMQTDTDCPATQDTWRTSAGCHSHSQICCTLTPAVWSCPPNFLSILQRSVGLVTFTVSKLKSLLLVLSTRVWAYSNHMWGDILVIWSIIMGPAFLPAKVGASVRVGWEGCRGRLCDHFELGGLQVAQPALAWVSQWPHGWESASVCVCGEGEVWKSCGGTGALSSSVMLYAWEGLSSLGFGLSGGSAHLVPLSTALCLPGGGAVQR